MQITRIIFDECGRGAREACEIEVDDGEKIEIFQCHCDCHQEGSNGN